MTTYLKPALFVVALVLLWLGMLLLGAGTVDHRILLDLYAGHRPLLADSARLITMLGDGRVVTLFAAVGAIVLILRKQSWPALVLVVGTALGKAVTELQKYEFNRLRPDENPHLVAVHNLSFPSGHSANAMMTYVALTLFLAAGEHRRFWFVGAVTLALLVGLSRVMLGVHWPSDVVGGWSYGLFWAFLIYVISRVGRRTGRAT
ncbi:MAG TPA: phosphatase PAP2 family protein [Sphingomicrobium sp.]|nr:phosphatase PAP2 family protein [Sphingomicrobium sp.]